MSSPPFVIGIDLGTSNCAVAFAEPLKGNHAPIVDFPVVQAQRPGDVRAQPLLPSCLYLAGEHELDPAALQLPWGSAAPVVAGEFARWQGARVPGRLVTSAKSWLCHAGVDRSARILPWGAPPEIPRLSPIDASARLLQHMVAAWNHEHPGAVLADQDVIITVPASFDEVARALTVSAARQAGIERFTLVEEPQAAFYDFTARHRRNLDEALRGIRLVLVIDVGGGTSDFTLVQATANPEGPVLERLAVGDHLMLGGENMDAALGRTAEARMIAGGRKLTAAQWTQLVQAARLAKETLLGENPPEFYNISIAGEGSRLLGGTLSARLFGTEAEEAILNGFFPITAPRDLPQRSARAALQELGLPYAKDAAITRHLAAFLSQHARAGFMALGGNVPPDADAVPRPDAILLNGGVFNSPKIVSRLVQALSGWWPEQPDIPLLEHVSLELAVARGAAYYGLVRRGLGRKIGGGSAHALYMGLTGNSGQPEALCVVPRGHEEGEPIELENQRFHLTLGRPVQFPLYSTTADRLDRPGAIVPVAEDLHALRPIHTLLKSGGQTGEVPVHLRAALTEIGTLELFCVSEISNERWRLEFELRDNSESAGMAVTESMPVRFEEARVWIDVVWGGKPGQTARRVAELPANSVPPKDVRQLWSSLERSLGPRESWRVPVLRELWSVLFAGAPRRRRSADHERIFFQLAGFTLRPGFGYPLDGWRCEQTFSLFPEGVQNHKEHPVWTEFWVLWRRIAGGLKPEHQLELWHYLKPFLAIRLGPKAAKHAVKPKGVHPAGLEEMVRTAASLEHIEPAEKSELGMWLAAKLGHADSRGGPWAWALGRLGARVPLYGSVHQTVPPGQASAWIRLILDLGADRVAGGTFALAQLARLSGDRARDIDEALRAEAVAALEKSDAPETWRRMAVEVMQLEAADEARALGDTLPSGLRLAPK